MKDAHRFAKEILASFFSGFAALIYQIVWQRVISQEVGVDLLSTKMSVVSFLLGLALGYRSGSALSNRQGLTFARWFAGCEAAIGLFGIVSVPLLRMIRPLALSHLPYFDLVLCSVLLLLPTFFMGLSTPMLIGAVRQRGQSSGAIVGRVYGANVLGAAVGSFVSGLALIELLGLRSTSYVAVMANFGAVAIALSLSADSTATELTDAAPKSARTKLPPGLVVAAICLGTASLVFEMVSFRSVFFFFGLAAYQFPFVLGSFLLAMAAGEWLGGKLSDSKKRRFGLDPTSLLMVLTALSIAVAYLATFWTPVAISHGAVVKEQILRLVMFSLLFMSPIVFISAFFPLMLNGLSESRSLLASRTSDLLFIFTISNVFGGLFASFVLLPMIGSPKTLVVVMLLTIAAVLCFSMTVRRVLVGTLSLAVVLFFYHDYWHTTQPEQLEVLEDHTGVFTVSKTDGDEVSVSLFRTPTASAYPGAFASQLTKWTMNDLALSPDFKPRRALVIGLGNGMVAYDLAMQPSIDEVVVVELMPTVVDLVFKYSQKAIREVLQGPKVKVLIGDGRRYLQQLPPGSQFDIIEVAVFHPWTAGASNVYTEDFFRVVAPRLTPKGVLAVFSYYPLVDATAMRVCPYGYATSGWNRRFHFYSNEPLRISHVVDGTSFLVEQHCSWDSPKSVSAGLSRLVAGQSDYRNTDDLPLLEYYFFRHVLWQVTGIELRKHQDVSATLEPITQGRLKCFNSSSDRT